MNWSFSDPVLISLHANKLQLKLSIWDSREKSRESHTQKELEMESLRAGCFDKAGGGKSVNSGEQSWESDWECVKDD